MAAERLGSILNHFKPSSSDTGVSGITQKNPDDIVITLAVRTPLTKARRGGFKDSGLDFMVYALLKEALAKSKLDPSLIEDVCLGNVCSYSQFRNDLLLIVYIFRLAEAKPLTLSVLLHSQRASLIPRVPLWSTASAHPA